MSYIKSKLKDKNFQMEKVTMGHVAKKIKHPYVTRVEGVCGGEPIIVGTRTPVRSIVGYYFNLKYSVDKIVNQLPYLTPAQIFDALSYYYDHKEEIDQLICENSEEYLMKKYPPGKYKL